MEMLLSIFEGMCNLTLGAVITVCAAVALGFWACCRVGDREDQRNGWK